MAKGLADRYAAPRCSLSLPSTRVDAFNIDMAQRVDRAIGDDRGLRLRPRAARERMRDVINKMVTEEDLIETVAAAFSAGWRRVKLYFMCGLPTETDEDVLQIAEGFAAKASPSGREIAGHDDIRCTVSIGASSRSRTRRSRGPHKPMSPPLTSGCASSARRCARTASSPGRSGSATTTASPGSSRDSCPVVTDAWAGSLRRCGARGAASTAGASTSPMTSGWPPRGRSGWHRRRPRLVHHPRARVRRGPAVGPPRLRSRQGLAVAGLGGRPRSRLDRHPGLSLDPLLRLRCVPSSAPTSRSAPRVRRCCRSAWSDSAAAAGFGTAVPGDPEGEHHRKCAAAHRGDHLDRQGQGQR